ncbi:MAG: hypothetical protein EA383_14515 [Spirochaetaceae bacterium]|nr:MAG: hypothetical protein EA383_14515 [Spirochaetaceae bacterium]
MPAAAKTVFRPYRRRLVFTYTLSLTEFILELMYPFTIGLAINGFIAGEGLVSIVPLTAVWIAQSAVGAFYQMGAARMVARIYTDISGRLALRDRVSQDATSEVAARVTMVENVGYALADVVPMLIGGIVTIVGSTVMLFLFDLRAGIVALALVAIIAGLQWWFSVRAVDLNQKINTLRESQVSVVVSAIPARITDYLRALTRLKVKFKDVETGVWTMADVFALAAILVVLYLVAGDGAYNAGAIYSMVAYVMNLTDSLENAPILVDEGAHLYDVASRVAAEVEP